MNSINTLKIAVVIPAFNEEASIGKVIEDIPKENIAVIVVGNNNSTDNTKIVAKKAGAIVVDEPRKGYGWACLKAIEYIESKNINPDILVFLDGDYSDYPQELTKVIQPIVEDGIDLVIGSRALGVKDKGSMTGPQVFGNWLSTRLMKLFYGVTYTDLGPFRAIKYPKYKVLGMQDKTYGWTIEMQIKAAKQKMTYREVAVNYKKRIGVSKVSGTVKGTILAGYKIIWSIIKYRF